MAAIGPTRSAHAAYVASLGISRLGVIRLGVVVCAAAAAVVGVLSLDDALTRFDDGADENASHAYLDRSYGDDGSIVGSRSVIEDARLWIPEDAAYRIAVGSANDAFSADVAPAFLRYFLLPRRESAEARWVLCLGCNPSALGDRFVVLSQQNGILFGRLTG